MESLPSSNPAFFLVAGVSGQILPGRPGPRPVPGSEAGSARTPVPGVGVAAACTSVMADERCGSSRRNFPAVEKRCKSSLFRALENVAAGAGCRGHPAATRVQPGLRLAGLGEGTQVLGEVTDTGPSSRPVGVRRGAADTLPVWSRGRLGCLSFRVRSAFADTARSLLCPVRPAPALALVLTGLPVSCSAPRTGARLSEPSGAGGGLAFPFLHAPSSLCARQDVSSA